MIYFYLNKDLKIPALGFGTWQLDGKTAIESVLKALEIGYRLIDTADAYSNHQEVGKAINSSGILRKDIFLTTKVWRESLHENDVIESVNRFLTELKTDYIDLLLIHWPNKKVPIKETLLAMQSLKDKGFIKSIGVSNFAIKHLNNALKAGVKIDNNQVEFHPSLNQKELKEFCDKNNILITAYSPIAQGKDLRLELIKKLSKKYSRSTSQIILNWLINKNIVAIPRSSEPKHIEDNFKTLDWKLRPEDIKLIDQINTNDRIVNPEFSEFDQ